MLALYTFTRTALVTEAISIYTTYVALNALSPVGVPDVVRQKLEGDISQHSSGILCITLVSLVYHHGSFRLYVNVVIAATDVRPDEQ